MTIIEQTREIVGRMTPGPVNVLYTNQPVIRSDSICNVLRVEDCDDADANAKGFVHLRNTIDTLLGLLEQSRDALDACVDIITTMIHDDAAPSVALDALSAINAPIKEVGK